MTTHGGRGWLVTVLAGLKGAAMKLGQMLSVPDVELVPENHRALFRLELAELRAERRRCRSRRCGKS
ncbi:hypothetical protein [Nocardia abscessus]|uniref:hypothetical protein n=1 Tax=Nocardia abscessus TaxID=120957 RepID=UPI0005B8E4D8